VRTGEELFKNSSEGSGGGVGALYCTISVWEHGKSVVVLKSSKGERLVRKEAGTHAGKGRLTKGGKVGGTPYQKLNVCSENYQGIPETARASQETGRRLVQLE